MIDAMRVVEITRKSLIKEPIRGEKYPDNVIVINALVHMYPLVKEELAKYESEVKEMLLSLPLLFGIGIPFIALCYDKENNLWTGEHMTMESLFALGCALEFLEFDRRGEDLPRIVAKEKLFE